MDMSKAPVLFNDGVCVFSNENNRYPIYVTSERVENRLLGLFRLWNAKEYYYPHKDIMDHNWNDLLLEYIPEMIKGTDAESYYLTLYALSAKTNDGHIYFDNDTIVLSVSFGGDYTTPVGVSRGHTAIPVIFEQAEGQFVVRKSNAATFLQRGDVVVSIDGVDINNIVEEIKQYIAVPNDEKLKRVMPYLPLCKSAMPEIAVLRDGEVLTGTVITLLWDFIRFEDPYFKSIKKSYELLSNNIGLINPMRLSTDQVHIVMEEFSDTSGLIIDLRQYPGSNTIFLLAEYLLDYIKPFAIYSRPFAPVPGLFFNARTAYAGPGFRVSEDQNSANGSRSSEVAGPYFYDKPIVILMDQRSQSACENMIMCLRTGPNVTLIGSNSIGANGNITYLPLPGGTRMSFTNLGVYTPEGGQTQRVGLVPDIYVERTIEGIRDGRDELMEAAVEFLLGQ